MGSSSLHLHLPIGLIELILSNCPLKSVVRFKSISKSWQSIISDRRFARIHRIRRSKLPENQNYFFVCGLGSEHHSRCLHLIRLEDGKFLIETSFAHPSGEYVDPLCYCDGLILLHSKDKGYMLWTPLIGKHIVIPPFNPESHREAFRNWPRTNPHPHHRHIYHDPVTDDYKILFLYSECYATYSCNGGRWGEIRGVPRDLVSDGIRRQYAEFVDGSFYIRLHDGSDPVIKCFDARDGMKLHKKLRQPEEADSLVYVDLEAVSGRLCLYGCSDYRDERLQLWVMEENGSFENKCWRKLISMEVKEKGMRRAPLPMCLNNEDDVVLWTCSIEKNVRPRKQYYIYNSRGNRNFKHIDVPLDMDFDQCFSYSENLYMPS